MNIDKIDNQILDYLGKNGRMTYASLASKVGLTSTAVGQRIQKMTDQGLILGFGVLIDREKLGVTLQVIISLELNFSKLEPFTKMLTTFNEIEYCFRVTGADCMIMKANFKNNAHLLDFINKISLYGRSKSSIIIERVI